LWGTGPGRLPRRFVLPVLVALCYLYTVSARRVGLDTSLRASAKHSTSPTTSGTCLTVQARSFIMPLVSSWLLDRPTRLVRRLQSTIPRVLFKTPNAPARRRQCRLFCPPQAVYELHRKSSCGVNALGTGIGQLPHTPQTVDANPRPYWLRCTTTPAVRSGHPKAGLDSVKATASPHCPLSRMCDSTNTLACQSKPGSRTHAGYYQSAPLQDTSRELCPWSHYPGWT